MFYSEKEKKVIRFVNHASTALQDKTIYEAIPFFFDFFKEQTIVINTALNASDTCYISIEWNNFQIDAIFRRKKYLVPFFDYITYSEVIE